MKDIIHPSDIDNGKIFPISILNLLKDFKTDNKLKLYQQYIYQLMTSNHKFRNMLIYHDLGTGKTITGISVINSFLLLENFTIIILLPASLKDSNWVKAIKEWMDKKLDSKKINFVSFNAPNFYDKLIEIKNKLKENTPIIYLIDEAHNFFHNVLSNITKGEGSKNALNVYNNIRVHLEEDESSKIILLSATPILTDPFELALIYNLLRPNTFPKQKSEFEELFVNNENKNLFITRILGLTSYYKNNNKESFPSVTEKIMKIPMSKFQYNVYSFYHEKEKKQNSSYKIYTRTASNFVFPSIESKINGFTRPRPNMFADTKEYNLKIKSYLSSLKIYLKKNVKKNDIIKDFETCKKDYRSNIIFYIFTSKKASESLKLLYNSSCKMTSILFANYIIEGKSMIYSSFTSLEGMEIMSLYLNCLDMNYLYYSGKLNLEERASNLQKFNNKNNILGKKYKIFLLSSAGIEGISLTNVRSVHILEPSWNQGVIKQLIGRAVRLNSHQELPPKERNVSVYHYLSIIKKEMKLTDETIYENSIENEKVKNEFLDLVRISAFDCELLQNNNDNKSECFHFNQDTYKKYFEDNKVGPAYQKDISMITNNGLFSSNSNVKEITLYNCKILHGKKKIYGYVDFNSGLVYDTEYNNIPIGILEKNDRNVFKTIPSKQENEFIFIMK